MSNRKIATVDQEALEQLSQRAAGCERKRMNLNIHTDLDDPIQRVINALEPETELGFHRHTDRWELFVHIEGRLQLTLFTDPDQPTIYTLSATDTKVVEIPIGVWHSVRSLESGSAILELKPGPYSEVVAHTEFYKPE